MRGLVMTGDHRGKITAKVHAAAARALTDAGYELKRVANVRVPKETGILEGSATVEPATSSKLEAVVGYGGLASAYAARQHEETTWKHDPPQRAKWLELAAKEKGQRIMKAAGRQMRNILR